MCECKKNNRLSVTIRTEFIKCTVTCIDETGLEGLSEGEQIAELVLYAMQGVGYATETAANALKSVS